MKFKFPDRVAAIEFVNHLASPEEFSMNGIVHGDVVDVPGVEPDGCSPGWKPRPKHSMAPGCRRTATRATGSKSSG
jgi:hypothetical protein